MQQKNILAHKIFFIKLFQQILVYRWPAWRTELEKH